MLQPKKLLCRSRGSEHGRCLVNLRGTFAGCTSRYNQFFAGCNKDAKIEKWPVAAWYLWLYIDQSTSIPTHAAYDAQKRTSL